MLLQPCSDIMTVEAGCRVAGLDDRRGIRIDHFQVTGQIGHLHTSLLDREIDPQIDHFQITCSTRLPPSLGPKIRI